MDNDHLGSHASAICGALLGAADLLADLAPGRSRVVIFVINQESPDLDTISGTMGAMGYRAGATLGSEGCLWDGSPEDVMPILDDVLGMMEDACAQRGLVLPIVRLGEAKQG
jgi:hypothetical protein